MRKLFIAILMLSLGTTLAHGQSSFARVSGTVSDQSGALIPGVTVTATDIGTAVASTQLTNESGIYTFASLLPGNYKLSVSLPGFQPQTLTDIRLIVGEQYRFNFTLKVGNAASSVDVTIATDSLLATSSSTVGTTLTEQKVSALPLVGNDVLDLISTLAGVGNDAGNIDSVFGREAVTLAGVPASNISTVRDGIMVQDTRWPGGINSATVINPDLVGEIRLILAPVDAELGRGNGSVQISTRSGTNRYSGAATWSIRNNALDADTWANNRTVPKPVRNWSNNHQYTVSFGGPIVRNKTFFYGVFDGVTNRNRSIVNQTVLTACARKGIFRYFNNWNNGNAGAATTTGTNATTAVVDVLGNPKTPATDPNSTNPYSGGPLQYVSVFGPLASAPTTPDCSDAQISPTTLVPTGSTSTWDPFRTQMDPTGFIARYQAYMPAANNFNSGDGLNTSAVRWLRKLNGTDNLFGFGEDVGDRKQYNAKVDHNFNSNHKANFNLSYERNKSSDTAMLWPDTFEGSNYRNPIVLTASFTSTLSASLLNEARFGLRKTGTNIVTAFDVPENRAAMDALYPADVNGTRVIVRPGTGGVNFQTVGPIGSRGAWPSTLRDDSPLWTYADTLSWTKSAHAFKWGGELRLSSSKSILDGPGNFGAYDNYVQAIGGNITGTAPTNNQTTSLAKSNPALLGLMDTNSSRARDLMTYLAGSLGPVAGFNNAINQRYFMIDPTNLETYASYKDTPFQTKELKQSEVSIFFKDDYKITKRLTLNLGLRWDYYGVPYNADGLTVAPVGGGSAMFGVSGRGYENWMKPSPVVGGQLYDPSLLTQVEFVGPKSPNPGRSVYRNDYNNVGPAIGFAWQLPWFGEGKTTLRGGYQLTYQGARSFSTLESILTSPPGSTQNAGYDGVGSGDYLDLTDLTPSVIPVPLTLKPMEAIPITQRNQSFTGFDPSYSSPYVQNLTMTLTRTLTRNLNLETRYVGTLSRKNYQTINLNTNNFLYNGLLDELKSIRAGGESPMLDTMFAGINICATGCTTLTGGQTYGPVGTPTGSGSTLLAQTAAMQMRNSNTFNVALANGSFAGIAGTLNTLNYTKGTTPANNSLLPTIPAGVRGAVLRFSGLFPEDFITANPQYATANLFTNTGHSNYHSLQTQLSLRATHGISASGTYTWSKNLGTPGTYTNPVDRNEWSIQGSNRTHEMRANGVVELPIGPNKLLFANSTGVFARLIERWQMAFIYNVSSGAWQTISAQSMLYANGTPDIVGPFPVNKLAAFRWGYRDGNNLNGRYFDPNQYVSLDDPQCGQVTSLQGLGARCTLESLALIVPAGTEGSFVLGDGRSALTVLQNPQPGTKGTFGRDQFKGLPTWSFDANMSKTFQLTESKSLQVRFDARNVLNHPQPSIGALNINTGDNGIIGSITNKSGSRAFQGQIRLAF